MTAPLLAAMVLLQQVGAQPSAPTLTDRISFQGPASYTTGGVVGFSAMLQALTRDSRQPLAVIAQDTAGAYTFAYNDTPTAGTSGTALAANAGTYALSNNETLIVQVDDDTALTVTFRTAQFVSIGAATATEVCGAINEAFAAAGVGAVATVDSNAVLITSDSAGAASQVNVTGGTASSVFAFASTAGTAGVATDNLKIFSVATAAEVAASTNLSALTWTALVISQ